jgi:translation initiation factor 3 subunit B
MLSYWSPTSGNLPAMINIVSVPDRKEICSRKCFDILEGHMLWHNEGDYLCVHMIKQQGKKRTYVVMIFRVKEAGVPVELIELTDGIVSVSWEPSGEKLAFVHGDAKNATVSFYSMAGAVSSTTSTAASSSAGKKSASSGVAQKEVALYHQLANTPCTEVAWSPAGGVCAITHYIPGDTCSFQLYDVDACVSLATRKHDRCSGLYWDPSGRMIASVSTSVLMIGGNSNRGPPLQVDDCYNLWSFQGTPICVVRKEKLYRFIWRPRPNNLISLEGRRAIVKNLKKYEKVFEREDKIRKAEIHQEATARRNSIAADFLALLAARKEDLARRYNGNTWKVIARDGYDENDNSHYDVECRMEEVVVSVKEQILH